MVIIIKDVRKKKDIFFWQNFYSMVFQNKSNNSCNIKLSKKNTKKTKYNITSKFYLLNLNYAHKKLHLEIKIYLQIIFKSLL